MPSMAICRWRHLPSRPGDGGKRDQELKSGSFEVGLELADSRESSGTELMELRREAWDSATRLIQVPPKSRAMTTEGSTMAPTPMLISRMNEV